MSIEVIVFSVSVTAMIAAVVAHVVADDRSTVTGVTPLSDRALACSFNRHLCETRNSFWVFSRVKKCYAELRCELVRGSAFIRYEQFEISPETIEQELQPAVCEQRQNYLLYKDAVSLCLSVCNPPPFRHDRRTANKLSKHFRIDTGLALT